MAAQSEPRHTADSGEQQGQTNKFQRPHSKILSKVGRQTRRCPPYNEKTALACGPGWNTCGVEQPVNPNQGATHLENPPPPPQNWISRYQNHPQTAENASIFGDLYQVAFIPTGEWPGQTRYRARKAVQGACRHEPRDLRATCFPRPQPHAADRRRRNARPSRAS